MSKVINLDFTIIKNVFEKLENITKYNVDLKMKYSPNLQYKSSEFQMIYTFIEYHKDFLKKQYEEN